MKQVVQDLRSGKPSVLDVPVPMPAKGQVLVRTAASLVSAGTERTLIAFAGKSAVGKAVARPDLVRQTLEKARQEGPLAALQAVQSRLDQPVPLGYSSSGVVEAVGDGVESVKVGDRVACAGGGHAVHAEFALVPENLLARLPAGVELEAGAFGTLGAIALHGFRLSGARVGERVAVLGLGLLGQLAMQIVQAAGCRALGVDLDPERVSLAEQVGGRAVIREQALEAGRAFTDELGFDAVMICAHTDTNDPLVLAGDLARDRAKVVLVGVVGMQLPRRLYYEKELDLVVSRSYGPGRYDPAYEQQGHDYPIGYVRWTERRNIESFLELLERRRVVIEHLISHRFPVGQAGQAYELLRNGQAEHSLAILITYDQQVGVERRVAAPHPAVRRDPSIKLGMLGAGNFAQRVTIPILRRLPQVELVGIATAAGLSAAHSASRFGFGYAGTDPAALINDEHINTVAVLTRHVSHAAATAEALSAGKHVFCEKPLSIDLEGLEQVRAALEGATGLLTVGFNRRFAPMAQRMKAFLSQANQPISAHYRVNAGQLPADHWVHDPKVGGGRLIGEVCHFVDFLVYLIGSMPLQATASSLPNSSPHPADNLHLSLTFPDGSLGSIQYVAAGDRAYPKERVEAFGGRRVAVLDDFRRLELVSGGRRKVTRSRWRQDKGHRRIWQAFIQAILEGGPPPIAYAELEAVTRATFAASQSLRSGRPVDLEAVD